jgi:hypothetical protein
MLLLRMGSYVRWLQRTCLPGLNRQLVQADTNRRQVYGAHILLELNWGLRLRPEPFSSSVVEVTLCTDDLHEPTVAASRFGSLARWETTRPTGNSASTAQHHSCEPVRCDRTTARYSQNVEHQIPQR